MVMVRIFKKHRHSIVGEKQPSPFHRLHKLTIVPVYLSLSQYLIKRKGSWVSKRERKREKRAKTAKLITFSGCSLTIKSSLKIRHPVKSFQMRSMVLFAEEGRRRRICLFCKLIKDGSSLPGLDGPTTRKIRDCIREAGGRKDWLD